MNTNAWYGRLLFFLNKTQRKNCFVVGAKKFLYKPEILIVRFVEIRYESFARDADGLRI